MRKIVKILSSALCAVMCIFVLAGCGNSEAQLNSEASVNKNGLTESTKMEYAKFLANRSEKDALDASPLSYRFTVKTSTTESEQYVNGISKLDGAGNLIELALKLNVRCGDLSKETTVYLKDSYIYVLVENGDEKLGYKTPYIADQTPVEDTSISSKNDIFDLLNEAKMENLYVKAWEIYNLNDIKVTQYETVGVARYGVEYTDTELGAENKYFIDTKNNVILGIEWESSQTNGTTNTITVSRFDDEIKYPSFKDCAEVEMETIQAVIDILFS